MSERKPFIPRDKPKSWVVFVLAVLTGLGFGLLAFLAAIYGIKWLEILFKVAFFVCWATGLVAWGRFAVGMIGGEYRSVDEVPWKDQKW